jgi:hypothetical protein
MGNRVLGRNNAVVNRGVLPPREDPGPQNLRLARGDTVGGAGGDVQAALAPSLYAVAARHGYHGAGPDEAALLNTEMIEQARQLNEEEIWGEGGLIQTLRGGINNQDQKAARQAVEGLLNSNDPFFDRMMRQIQDQYGLQSREALQAAANQMGARGRSLSGFQRAMLTQQSGMARQQALTTNEMQRYGAMQEARAQAAQLFTGLSADMRESLRMYAEYVAAFPHTRPSFEGLIFPPDEEDIRFLGAEEGPPGLVENPNFREGGEVIELDADGNQIEPVGEGPEVPWWQGPPEEAWVLGARRWADNERANGRDPYGGGLNRENENPDSPVYGCTLRRVMSGDLYWSCDDDRGNVTFPE